MDYNVFQNVTPPDPSEPTLVYSSADFDFRLRPESVAVDTGCQLPNVNDDFSANAPDLGSLEVGKPLPHYGPRIW